MLTSDALANMKNDLCCPVPPFPLNPKKEVLLSLSMAFAEIYDYCNTCRGGEREGELTVRGAGG